MKSRARKDGETIQEFEARIKRGCKSAIVACMGNISQMAEIYGIDDQLMEDLISTSPRLSKHLKEIRSQAHRSGEEVVLHDDPDPAPEDPVRKLSRKNWPRDPEERAKDLYECLKVSLVENEGDLVECSEFLNVPVDEIFDLIDASEELQGYQNRGLRVKALRAQSQMFKNSDSGNHQANKMVLTNLLGDQWSDKSQVDVRKFGFEPPEKDEDVPNVLSIVQGAKDA